MVDRPLSLKGFARKSTSKNQPQKGTESTKNLKRTFCAFLWLSSISWRAGLSAVSRSRGRQRRQTLAVLQLRSHRRCTVPVTFVQPLKLRELAVRVVLLLQPRVRQK